MLKIRKKEKSFLHIFAVIFLISAICAFFVEIKLLMISFLGVMLILSYIFYKKGIGQEAIIAFLFALFVTSYFSYEYTNFNLFLGKINLFPLICWSAGLVILREIYERIPLKRKLILSCIIYWSLLFLFEYLGYWFLNIRLNSNFPGLFNLSFMHASLGMKFYYLSAGPLFLLITNYLEVK